MPFHIWFIGEFYSVSQESRGETRMLALTPLKDRFEGTARQVLNFRLSKREAAGNPAFTRMLG